MSRRTAWLGGRIRYDARDRPVYVIQSQHAGRRYILTLGAVTEAEALAEYALFERDPSGYRSRRDAAARSAYQAVRIDADRVSRFIGHLESPPEPRSPKYVSNLRNSLAWWAERGRLAGKDLRSVTLAELNHMLDGVAGRKHKIIHLKSFCGWLRGRGELLIQNDPTVSLLVPQARPEKARRKKRHTPAEVERTYRMVNDQAIRDALRVRCFGGGMHYSELVRLVSGDGEVNELRGYGEIAGTISFPHKSGRPHVVSIDAATLAAVKRLRARGNAPSDSYMGKIIKKAAKANGVAPLELGAIRHSFASWRTSARKVEPAGGGVSLAEVAAAMGHLNPRTTAIFYDGTEVPPMIVPPLQLVHPDDPVQIAANKKNSSRRKG